MLGVVTLVVESDKIALPTGVPKCLIDRRRNSSIIPPVVNAILSWGHGDQDLNSSLVSNLFAMQ